MRHSRSAMAYHIPAEETLDRAGLDALQAHKLRAMLREIGAANPFWRARFERFQFDPSADPIDKLPLLTRAEIEADQASSPPYGTNLTYPPAHYVRLHETSGSSGGAPLRLLDCAQSWAWWLRCWGIIYRAADVNETDRLFFPFSFGPFIGFWGAFESAFSLDRFCLAGGGMTTEARLRQILEHKITVVCCTPTYAMRMAEIAASIGLDLAGSTVRALIVAGEPGGHIPAMRQAIEFAWGARVFDHAGMTEVGPWGFECSEDPGGFHVMESEFIAEVIDPATGVTLGEGALGELVLTNLGRWGTPVIRYRTGDQVKLIRRRCACGRWFSWLDRGILGRSDDMLYIRGNNVFPSAIEDAIRSVDGVVEYRVEVVERGSMSDLTIEVEGADAARSQTLPDRVREAIQNRFHFQPAVRLAGSGTLPRFEMKARRFVRSGSARRGG